MAPFTVYNPAPSGRRCQFLAVPSAEGPTGAALPAGVRGAGGQRSPGQGRACAAKSSSAPPGELGPPGRGTWICPSPVLAMQSQRAHLPSSSPSSSPASVPSLRVPWQRGWQGWLREEMLQLWCKGSEPPPPSSALRPCPVRAGLRGRWFCGCPGCHPAHAPGPARVPNSPGGLRRAGRPPGGVHGAAAGGGTGTQNPYPGTPTGRVGEEVTQRWHRRAEMSSASSGRSSSVSLQPSCRAALAVHYSVLQL